MPTLTTESAPAFNTHEPTREASSREPSRSLRTEKELSFLPWLLRTQTALDLRLTSMPTKNVSCMRFTPFLKNWKEVDGGTRGLTQNTFANKNSGPE